MSQQANSTVEPGADPRKYVVGTKLRFVGYSRCELPGKFRPGVVLRVVEKNGCGMGIDVKLWRRGKKSKRVDGMVTVGRGRRRRMVPLVDMVWPEEVEVVTR